MSTKADSRQKRTDDERLRHFYLGRDACGDVHHFDRATNTVYTITGDGRRPFVDQLTADKIGRYWDYVESRRGEWEQIQIPACTFTAAFEGTLGGR